MTEISAMEKPRDLKINKFHISEVFVALFLILETFITAVVRLTLQEQQYLPSLHYIYYPRAQEGATDLVLAESICAHLFSNLKLLVLALLPNGAGMHVTTTYYPAPATHPDHDKLSRADFLNAPISRAPIPIAHTHTHTPPPQSAHTYYRPKPNFVSTFYALE